MKKILSLVLYLVIFGCSHSPQKSYEYSGSRISKTIDDDVKVSELSREQAEAAGKGVMSEIPKFKVGTPYFDVLKELKNKNVAVLSQDKKSIDVEIKIANGGNKFFFLYIIYIF